MPKKVKREVERAWEALKERSLRVTRPRRAILEVLATRHGPFTAEEVFHQLTKGECDPVTVYRSLTTLEEAGLVRRCDFGDGVYRYEYNHADHHHHHLICRQCRKVETMDLCVADELERLARRRGYAEVTHTLEIFGLCPGCLARGRSKPA